MADQTNLTPAHLRLIDALARKDAEDYLREQAALRLADAADRTDPVPLLQPGKAA